MSGLGWLRPEWLAGLLLVPAAALVVGWSLRRQSRALDAFAAADVRGRTQTLPRRGRLLRAGLLLLALAALLVAAAGPTRGTERVEAAPAGPQIVFAVDISRSMLARDVDPDRLERAKLAVRQILAVLPTAQTGLVVFAGEASLVIPLTVDASALELYLASVGTDWISDPSTDLGNAVMASLDAFDAAMGPAGPGRAVVVLTDGEDHGGAVERAAAAVAERGVEIEAIGIGTPDGARIPLPGGGEWLESGGEPVVTRLEPEPLERLAEATGGVYAALGTGAAEGGLSAVIERLRRLDSAGVEGGGTERRADRYRWPLVVAVLALGIEAWLRVRARPRRTAAAPGPTRAVGIAAGIAVLAMAQAPSPADMYEEGRYREALAAWRARDRGPDADPADAYNRGNAAYRLGEFREAAASHAVAARTAGNSERAAAAWYNAGNARFRIAEAIEREAREPSDRFWDSSVAAYRESLLRDPGDMEAKHNLELALRRRQESGGGGGGGGGGGSGSGEGGGGGGTGVQPPSTGTDGAAGEMSQAEAERLLDALAAQEREALIRGEGDRLGGRPEEPGW